MDPPGGEVTCRLEGIQLRSYSWDPDLCAAHPLPTPGLSRDLTISAFGREKAKLSRNRPIPYRSHPIKSKHPPLFFYFCLYRWPHFMAPYAYVYSMCQTPRSRSLCVRHCSGRFTNIVVAVNTTWIKKESVLPPRFSFWVWRTSIVLWRCSYIPSWINDENDKARGPWPLLCLYTQRIWEGASSVVSVLLGTLMLLSQAPPWWPHLTSITSLLHIQWYRKLRLHRMKLGGHLQSVPKNLLNASHHLNQLKKIKLEILAPRTRTDWGRKERFKNGFWVFFFLSNM